MLSSKVECELGKSSLVDARHVLLEDSLKGSECH